MKSTTAPRMNPVRTPTAGARIRRSIDVAQSTADQRPPPSAAGRSSGTFGADTTMTITMTSSDEGDERALPQPTLNAMPSL